MKINRYSAAIYYTAALFGVSIGAGTILTGCNKAVINHSIPAPPPAVKNPTAKDYMADFDKNGVKAEYIGALAADTNGNGVLVDCRIYRMTDPTTKAVIYVASTMHEYGACGLARAN